MSTKHTPGLWHQEPLQATQGADIAIIGNGQVIAVIQHDPDIQTADEDDIDGDNVVWSEEDLANARLITSAPALLNALKALLKVVDEISNRSGWPDNAPRYAAKTAIDMAEGEAA